MTGTASVEVRVVFDAASRGRRGTVRIEPHTRAEGARSWHALGVVHILVAAALYYGIWWRVDPFLYMTLMMKTPVEVDLGAAAGMFGVPGAVEATRTEKAEASATVRKAQTALGSTVVGWLTASTASACALALAAGAAWARFRTSGSTRTVWLLVIFGAIALWLAAFIEWRSYGAAYPPKHLRIGIGGVVALCVCIGLLMGRFARGLSKLAAFALILGGVGTVVAIQLGARYEAIEPAYATATAMAAAFAIHSAYGWLTLPLLRWLR